MDHSKLDLEKSSNNNTAKQAVNMDNIFPYLDVCNNNLSQNTFDWLSKVSGSQIGMTVAAYDYGVFVSVPIDEDKDQQLPEDLEAVLAYARSRSCIVVRFDKDADVVEGLQNYDW